MDFETCFLECCQACNCSEEEFKLPLEILDQEHSDCKNGFAIQDDLCIWTNADKEKTTKNKVQEDVQELDTENLTKLQNPNCDCLKKPNKERNFSEKCNCGAKFRIFKNCRNPWNFPYSNWSSNHSELKDHSNFNKMLVDSVLELKEKVDVLSQILQECGLFNKSSIEDCEKREHNKIAQRIFGDFWHLLNFNKRLCATEEGIKKLALILEDHFENFHKKKSSFNVNLAQRDSLNFEKMPIGQRINLSKTRNDLLLDLVKNFLKVGSVEEIYSTQNLFQNNEEIKQTSEFFNKENAQKNALNGDDIIDTLKNLRIQFSKIEDNSPQSSAPQPRIPNEGRENAMKYFENKLEVIPEQAELTLNTENENVDDFRNKNGQNCEKNLSEDKEESEKLLCGITSKPLAQEALLKSFIDKIHFENFSKLNPPDKKCMKGNQCTTSKTEIPISAENQEYDIKTDFNSSSYLKDGCMFLESKSIPKFKSNHTISSPEKCTHHKEFKESFKEEKCSSESILDNLCKQNNHTSAKETHDNKEIKTRCPRKNLHRNTFTILTPPSRPSRNDYCPSVRCSSSRAKAKNEIEAGDKRPVTAPNSLCKNLASSSPKLPISQRNIKKNFGLNNVMNKNKISLSKKTFFKTS